MEIRERIVSRQNPLVKTVCALTDKKKRRECGWFRLDGKKLFCEAVTCGITPVYVFVRCEENEAIPAFVLDDCRICTSREPVIVPVSTSVFEKISEEKSPEGILTVVKTDAVCHRTVSAAELREMLIPGEKILLAEALRDPGNLGTVIRSCAALGIDRLILSEDCADLYHARTLRAAMGAIFRLSVCTVPCEEFADVIGVLRGQGRRVYAAALHRDAQKVGEFALRRGDCFVIGNEGHGLSECTVRACDGCAVIPMREGSESLNAAAAAAICIWETVRC